MTKQEKIEPAPTLYGALARAQAAIVAPGKNREVSVKMKSGGTYKFKYATLDHLIEHVRKPLTDNGLWFVQRTAPGEMITRIVHDSGEWIESAVPMPNLPNAPQEAGSVLTYFRRYSLSVALGLASDEDDDANVAEGNGYEDRRAAPAKPAAHSKLKTELRAFVHDMEGCGDWDTWVGLREDKETKRLIAEVRDKLPEWWEGGPSMPEEFVPLHRRIEILEHNLAEDKAALVQAG